MRAGLIQAVLPVDAAKVNTFSTKKVGVKVWVQEPMAVCEMLEVGFAVVEASVGDREPAGGEGAAVHLVVGAAGVAAEDGVVVAETVVAAEGEGALIGDCGAGAPVKLLPTSGLRLAGGQRDGSQPRHVLGDRREAR